ncbi:MAG: hypothetical protein IEMM0002_1516 [bacterium]|nr:MAG: hypothetical protein IEMM0002_1516 [bacterium]
MVILDEHLREMVAKDASHAELRETAKQRGYRTMRYDGMKKVLRGLTTMEEIDRVALPDG